jgi:hypothetical protein
MVIGEDFFEEGSKVGDVHLGEAAVEAFFLEKGRFLIILINVLTLSWKMKENYLCIDQIVGF